MDKQKAETRITEFIFERSYNYSVKDVIKAYLEYYKEGFYVSHSMGECIKNLKVELEVLTKKQRSRKR